MGIRLSFIGSSRQSCSWSPVFIPLRQPDRDTVCTVTGVAQTCETAEIHPNVATNRFHLSRALSGGSTLSGAVFTRCGSNSSPTQGWSHPNWGSNQVHPHRAVLTRNGQATPRATNGKNLSNLGSKSPHRLQTAPESHLLELGFREA